MRSPNKAGLEALDEASAFKRHDAKKPPSEEELKRFTEAKLKDILASKDAQDIQHQSQENRSEEFTMEDSPMKEYEERSEDSADRYLVWKYPMAGPEPSEKPTTVSVETPIAEVNIPQGVKEQK